MDYPMENLGFGPSVSYSNHNKKRIYHLFKENTILGYHEEGESNMIMIGT